MQEKIKVQSFVTEDSITLFWEKPKQFVQGSQYHILLDGEFVGVTGKTHYELVELEPDRDYEVQVVMKKLQTSIVTDRIKVRTGKKKRVLNITEPPYYASGDGKTMNTKSIQSAIDDCNAETVVYIPRGIFLTGALRLHGNMELYLAEGAVLQGTDRVGDYLPKIPSRFEGTELFCYSSLLNLGEMDHKSSYNCQNVIIRGKGTIASGGKSLAEKVIASERKEKKEYLDSLGEKIKECENADTIPGRVRPRLINISNCQNVRISGLTLKNGASWNVHMIYSDRIVTDSCTFYSEGVWNGDGWNPDSSSHCTIFGCTFYTGDDSIAIKSGKNPEGNIINRPSKNIWIADCKSVFGHGITIGSEMSGGVEDVHIWDCDVSKSLCGIEIKGTKKRGGYVRNVTVRDCLAARVLFHSVGYNDDGEGASEMPIFENCRFEDICITGEYLNDEKVWTTCEPIELCGFCQPGHELKNIEFRDIRLGVPGQSRKQKISMEYCKNISFYNVSV